MSYLEALSNVEVYQVSGRTGVRMPMRADRPDVPRIDVSINGAKKVSAILDSGAVLSIMSRSLANAVPLTPLGEFEGTFTGLLGEPIPVRFALLDSLEIGGMRIGKVPVAIMPDDKMQFIVNGRKAFHMDFLLGAHLLKEFRIELNFRSGSLLLTRIPPAERKPVANQNLFFDQFRPAVRGTLNRRGWFVFLLDTGSEVTFLNERELEALPVNLAAPKIHNATLQGLGGATKHGSKLDDIEIGVDRWAGTFRTIPMYESGPYERTAGILGENYLKNFDVVIDFGRMRVDLAPIGVAGLVENSPVLNDIGGRQVPP